MSNKPAKLLLLPLTLLAMSGCVGALTAPPVVVSDYCRIAFPIEYDSEKDTEQTRKAIEDHNSTYVCLCEHDCPEKVSQR